jgi:hypothetical protein
MDAGQVTKNAFARSLRNPASRMGQYEYVNQECMLITYRTGRTALQTVERCASVLSASAGSGAELPARGIDTAAHDFYRTIINLEKRKYYGTV